MKRTLIKNIKTLAGIRRANERIVKGAEMRQLPNLQNAWVQIEEGVIHSFGTMENAPESADETIDATGRFVLPCWCDSHTHIVYAGTREQEFVDKINGLTYEEIAKRGGGILNSAKLLATTGEDELFESAMQRLAEMESMGTGAVEIKSGYGLSYEGELKMLRVIRKLKEHSKLTIKATFLGAHTYPGEFARNHNGYLDILINKLLPEIAGEGLADFIDVFCEKGYFNTDETAQILEAGAKYGLRAKVHVNQFNAINGIATCVKQNALSVDHLEILSEDDITALKNSTTIPVALPGCSLFIKIPYTPARRIIDAGLPLALATDYNPGTAPSGNMNLIISLACINMGMLPEEAINAATINGAYAMGIENELGAITVGKKANLIITKPVSSLTYLPYAFGSNLVQRTIIA